MRLIVLGGGQMQGYEVEKCLKNNIPIKKSLVYIF